MVSDLSENMPIINCWHTSRAVCITSVDIPLSNSAAQRQSLLIVANMVGRQYVGAQTLFVRINRGHDGVQKMVFTVPAVKSIQLLHYYYCLVHEQWLLAGCM